MQRIHHWGVPGLFLSAVVLAVAGCSAGGVESGRPSASSHHAIGEHLDRDQLKTIVWARSRPPRDRIAAIDALLDRADASPADHEDTRRMLALLIPTENQWGVLEHVAQRAGEEKLTELAPALVRSYARPVPRPADADRPEARALAAMFDGRPAAETALAVFVDPDAHGRGFYLDRGRTRADAWALLSRLDPEGDMRRSAISRHLGGAPVGDPLIDALRDAASLGMTPVTTSELEWLTGAREREPSWWREAESTAAGLSADRRRPLHLRHLEPIRWSARHHPERLTRSRSELLADLRARLDGRPTRLRTANVSAGRRSMERLDDWADKLSWADLVTLLAIDDALADPGVRAAMFQQAEQDRRDTSTELGGMLTAVHAGNARAFEAVLFEPRATHRRGDREYVAPRELFERSDAALAHYHFHAQQHNNAEYAGPGPGDMQYARDHQRNCLVLTFINQRTLNVDYYDARGVTIDLGHIERPERP